jgi:hypothetical protein
MPCSLTAKEEELLESAASTTTSDPADQDTIVPFQKKNLRLKCTGSETHGRKEGCVDPDRGARTKKKINTVNNFNFIRAKTFIMHD